MTGWRRAGLPGALRPEEAAALAAEADRRVRDATAHPYLIDAGLGGITGHYIPATGDRTPPSRALVAFLEPLDGDTGALRVVPGSHALDERVLTDLMREPALRDENSYRHATATVPAQVLTSQPGDVIVFDEHL